MILYIFFLVDLTAVAMNKLWKKYLLGDKKGDQNKMIIDLSKGRFASIHRYYTYYVCVQ
jgi:hypothetical protein